MQDFLYLYNLFFIAISLDLFYLYKFAKTRKQRVLHHLILTFNKNKLKVNLQNYFKKQYLFLSAGLFIRFFEKRKSFKKNKIIKLLMAKFLRKVFLLAKIQNLILIIKKNPVGLIEFLKFLNTPIVHKLIDPVDFSILDETDKKHQHAYFYFWYFIFAHNICFTFNKQKKKGRIKRKILRKLVLENKIID